MFKFSFGVYAVVVALLCFSDTRAQVGFLQQCQTPDQLYGVCVNIRSCHSYIELLNYIHTIPYVEDFMKKSICGFDDLEPRVCCPIGTPGITENYLKPDEGTRYVETEVLPTPKLDNCGYSTNFHTTKSLVGGVDVQPGDWPWVAALGYRESYKSKTKYLCAGTLITRRHVITAAHCVYGRNDLQLVRLGEHDIQSNYNGVHPVDILIKDKIVHERYSLPSFSADIAILGLQTIAPLNDYIRPICLPVTDQLRNLDFTKSDYTNKAYVAGWGSVFFKGPTSPKLQEVEVPIVTNAECRTAYSRFTDQIIDSNVICAGYKTGGKDACKGDSGGPLMWSEPSPKGDHLTYYLIGIVSFGYKCAEPGYPGVYTRVSEYIPWIKANLY